jgi:hypothetical protein
MALTLADAIVRRKAGTAAPSGGPHFRRQAPVSPSAETSWCVSGTVGVSGLQTRASQAALARTHRRVQRQLMLRRLL